MRGQTRQNVPAQGHVQTCMERGEPKQLKGRKVRDLPQYHYDEQPYASGGAPFQAVPGGQVSQGGERSSPNGADRNPDIFMKTKMCKFHLLGICTKGTDCQFAHSKSEMNPLPDLYRTKLCKTLINTGQCCNPECKYAHNREELRITNTTGPSPIRQQPMQQQFQQPMQWSGQRAAPSPKPQPAQDPQPQQGRQRQQFPLQAPQKAFQVGSGHWCAHSPQLDQRAIAHGLVDCPGATDAATSGLGRSPGDRSRRGRQGRRQCGAEGGGAPANQAVGFVGAHQDVAKDAGANDGRLCDSTVQQAQQPNFGGQIPPAVCLGGGDSNMVMALVPSIAVPNGVISAEQPWLQWWCNQFQQQFVALGNQTTAPDGMSKLHTGTPFEPDTSPTCCDSESTKSTSSPERSGSSNESETPPHESRFGTPPPGAAVAMPPDSEGMAQMVYQQIPQENDHLFIGDAWYDEGIIIKNTFVEVQPRERTAGLRMVRTADGRLDLMAEQE